MRLYHNIVAVPRLLAFYGADDPLPHPVLAEARDALTAHYRDELGEPFTMAGARTPWSRSSPWAHPATCCFARQGVAVPRSAARSGTEP